MAYWRSNSSISWVPMTEVIYLGLGKLFQTRLSLFKSNRVYSSLSKLVRDYIGLLGPKKKDNIMSTSWKEGSFGEGLLLPRVGYRGWMLWRSLEAWLNFVWGSGLRLGAEGYCFHLNMWHTICLLSEIGVAHQGEG